MSDSPFSFRVNRRDPYKSFRFQVWWDGRAVAGISKVSALKQSTEVIEHRNGGNPLSSIKSPGTTKSEAVTFEKGLSEDEEFLKFASLVWKTDGAASGTISLKDFRKNIIIKLLNEEGVVVKAYNVYNCWVSEYQALPELDANTNAVAIEFLKLENEGFELQKK